MIPYLELQAVELGPVVLQPYGIIMLVGVVVGVWVTLLHARRTDLEPQTVRSALGWVIIGAFVGAHLFEVLAYQPERVAADPLLLLRLWEGQASTGGFIGSVSALLLYAAARRLPPGRLADVVTLGLLPGWFFGRMGCYVAHDHPGHRTDFLLAVAYPGGARHDLGFYEMLLAALLFALFEWVRRRTETPGRVALLIAAAYAPARFGLEFLRDGERRYGALTPAQIVCVLLFLAALIALWRQRRPSSAP